MGAFLLLQLIVTRAFAVYVQQVVLRMLWRQRFFRSVLNERRRPPLQLGAWEPPPFSAAFTRTARHRRGVCTSRAFARKALLGPPRGIPFVGIRSKGAISPLESVHFAGSHSMGTANPAGDRALRGFSLEGHVSEGSTGSVREVVPEVGVEPTRPKDNGF